jgi:hypothetical protein
MKSPTLAYSLVVRLLDIIPTQLEHFAPPIKTTADPARHAADMTDGQAFDPALALLNLALV